VLDYFSIPYSMLPEYEIRKALLVRLIEKHLPKRAIELTYMVATLKDKQVDDWLNAIIVEHCPIYLSLKSITLTPTMYFPEYIKRFPH
jgi:hypothetical protein